MAWALMLLCREFYFEEPSYASLDGNIRPNGLACRGAQIER